MSATDRTVTNRDDLAGLLGDIERLESVFDAWDETRRVTVGAYRRAIEAINGEALRRLVRALKTDPAAFAAMKDAVSDEVVYAVLRHHDIVKASLSERVEVALAGVRPMLAAHGGDVALVKVTPPSIAVRFLGACDGCAASALTFHAGVKKAVQESCPEITEVHQVKGHSGGEGGARRISPFTPGTEGNWLFVGTLADIPDAGVWATEAGGAAIILSRRGTRVSCFQNACAHLGLPIDDGNVANGIITCPHHGFRYDLDTGECLTASSVRLRAHAVRVTERRVEVRLVQ